MCTTAMYGAVGPTIAVKNPEKHEDAEDVIQ